MTILIDDNGYEIARLPGAGNLIGSGSTVPVSAPGWAHGCLFLKTNGTGDADAIYINTAAVGANSNFVALDLTPLADTHLTLNGIADITLLLNSLGALIVDDAMPASFTAAVQASGPNVFINSQNGGSDNFVGAGNGGSINITAGAGGADANSTTGGNSGAITLTAQGGGTSSGGTAGVAGSIRLEAAVVGGAVFYDTALAAFAVTSPTVTAATLFGGLVTSTQSGAVTFTLPLGSAMDTAKPTGVANADGFEWSLINLGSASGAATVTASSGHTVVGNAVVAITTTGRFLTKKTATNTWITYRLS